MMDEFDEDCLQDFLREVLLLAAKRSKVSVVRRACAAVLSELEFDEKAQKKARGK